MVVLETNGTHAGKVKRSLVRRNTKKQRTSKLNRKMELKT